LEIQTSVAVLLNVLLFVASLSAAFAGVTDAEVCQRIPSRAHVEVSRPNDAQPRQDWTVRSFGPVRARGVASLRAFGHRVAKPALEHSRRVLLASLTGHFQGPTHEDVASTQALAQAMFARFASIESGTVNRYVPRAPLVLLERPPRV
jgi:hypothetical protein